MNKPVKFKKGLGVRYISSQLRLLAKISPRKAALQAFRIFTTPPSRVKEAPSAAFAGAESLNFQFRGNEISGYRWNHAAEKKVLILHGHTSSILYFGHFVKPLVAKGYEVLGFDAPAHGRSGGKQIHALDYKNFVLEVIRLYGPITSFVTHSFGGLALSLALEALPHDSSWKAVLIAPATESTRAINNFFDYLHLGADIRKEFDEIITAVNDLPSDWYSVRRAAANIKADVLFLQDKQDPLTPLSDVEPIIAEAYPNFRFVLTNGLGHRNIYRDKSTVQLVIDFL